MTFRLSSDINTIHEGSVDSYGNNNRDTYVIPGQEYKIENISYWLPTNRFTS